MKRINNDHKEKLEARMAPPKDWKPYCADLWTTYCSGNNESPHKPTSERCKRCPWLDEAQRQKERA